MASAAGVASTSPRAIPKDYVPSAQSTHALYQLTLEGFEGPLDLLLFLIKRHQLDIFDIPIAFICGRYLDCLADMEGLQIDVAAEFLAMAAELVQMKSGLLLPQEAADDGAGADEEQDPRAALMARLLAYKIYKGATESLQKLPQLGRDVFARELGPHAVAPAALRQINPFSLAQAFVTVLKRQVPQERHRVLLETVSIRQRMLLILDMVGGVDALSFATVLASAQDAIEAVVTFLAVLEMARLTLLRLHVSDGGELYLHPRFASTHDALSRIAGADDAQYKG